MEKRLRVTKVARVWGRDKVGVWDWQIQKKSEGSGARQHQFIL